MPPAEAVVPFNMTTREVLRFGAVRSLLIANGLLYTGVALQTAALGLQAYLITGRTADLGWIGICEFLPAAFLVLVTGSVADRFDRRKVAVFAIGGEFEGTGDDVLAVAADHRAGAERQGVVGLVRRRDDGDGIGAEEFADLDGGAADAAGGA